MLFFCRIGGRAARRRGAARARNRLDKLAKRTPERKYFAVQNKVAVECGAPRDAKKKTVVFAFFKVTGKLRNNDACCST
jgi:hypothetical protein